MSDALPTVTYSPAAVAAGVSRPLAGARSLSGSGLDGAGFDKRETALWRPSMGSPDQIINTVKPVADARGRDSIMNDGYVHGAVAVHRDTIVGSDYRLNARPVLRVLSTVRKGFDDTWVKEFQQVVEARFGLIADSDAHWLDRRRRNTLTGLVRLAVGGFVTTGELCASGEWLNKDKTRPLNTAIQLFSPSRLSNPNNMPDTRYLRRGVRHDPGGRPLSYCIRRMLPTENFDSDSFAWDEIPVEKPWGRPQILHVVEQMEVDQTRGIADMVAALKHMKMTRTFSETVLQNAVVNASYAAALEADLPPDIAYGLMGGASGPENFETALGSYMTVIRDYFGGANNVTVDGATVPVLPPGVKLTTKTLGTPGGVGSNFEESLLRHIAAALGISYEEFSRDFSKVTYSAARASLQLTNRFMKSRKKVVADRLANFAYNLTLEEEIANGNVPLPRGFTRDDYYQPLVREAISAATWIGAGAGQIDEMKETQAAILRIRSGLSTYEREIARFGEDWRESFAQAAREQEVIGALALPFAWNTGKPTDGIAPISDTTPDPTDPAQITTSTPSDNPDDNPRGSAQAPAAPAAAPAGE